MISRLKSFISILLLRTLKSELSNILSNENEISRCTGNIPIIYDNHKKVIDQRSGEKLSLHNNNYIHRIFDIFSFTDEIGTLEIRLHEMNDWVDKFIIIESDETFSGKARELIFPKIIKQKFFQKFQPKIEYSICRYPDSMKVKADNFSKSIWDREYYMRDICMKESISQLDVKDHDILIVGDIDEIISYDGLGYIKSCAHYTNSPIYYETWSNSSVIGIQTDRLHFNFHCRSSNMAKWKGPSIVYGKILKFKTFQGIRRLRNKCELYIQSGWHLSNFHYGDYNVLVQKYDSFAHQELKNKMIRTYLFWKKKNEFINTLQYWKETSNKGGTKETNTHCDEVDILNLPKYVINVYQKFKFLLNDFQLDNIRKANKVNTNDK